MNGSSGLTVLAALVALVIAVYLWFTGQKDAGIFVGLWVPSLLSLATWMQTKRHTM